MNDKERYDQVKEIVDKALKGLAVLLKIGLPKPAAPEPSEFEKAWQAFRDSQPVNILKDGYCYKAACFLWRARGEDDMNSLPSCAIVGGNAAMYKSEAIEAIRKLDARIGQCTRCV